MGVEINIHPVQGKILRDLLFKTKARFSHLNSKNLENDHFSFHLSKLVELGLVEKTKDKFYFLTANGREFANRFDTEKIIIEKQAKVSVLLIPTKGNKYLVQKRLKQPYFGFYGFVSGKIKWGETLNEAALRELKEETNLLGKVTLVGIKHKMDYAISGNILEDKYFFVFKVNKTTGNLFDKFEGGENIWLTLKEILKLPDLFDGVAETIKMSKSKKLLLREDKYTVKSY